MSAEKRGTRNPKGDDIDAGKEEEEEKKRGEERRSRGGGDGGVAEREQRLLLMSRVTQPKAASPRPLLLLLVLLTNLAPISNQPPKQKLTGPIYPHRVSVHLRLLLTFPRALIKCYSPSLAPFIPFLLLSLPLRFTPRFFSFRESPPPSPPPLFDPDRSHTPRGHTGARVLTDASKHARTHARVPFREFFAGSRGRLKYRSLKIAVGTNCDEIRKAFEGRRGYNLVR